MADNLREQIELAILGRTATRAADAVLAVVEPAIRQAQAQALRDFEATITTQTAGRICEDLLARAAELDPEGAGDDA